MCSSVRSCFFNWFAFILDLVASVLADISNVCSTPNIRLWGFTAPDSGMVDPWSWGVSNILNINHSPVWPEISSSHHYRGDIWWPGINSSQPRYSGSLVGDNKPSNYLCVSPNLPGGTCQFLLILHSSPSPHPARPNSAWNSNDPVSYNDHLGLAIVLQTVPHNTRNLNKLKDANYVQTEKLWVLNWKISWNSI